MVLSRLQRGLWACPCLFFPALHLLVFLTNCAGSQSVLFTLSLILCLSSHFSGIILHNNARVWGCLHSHLLQSSNDGLWIDNLSCPDLREQIRWPFKWKLTDIQLEWLYISNVFKIMWIRMSYTAQKGLLELGNWTHNNWLSGDTEAAGQNTSSGPSHTDAVQLL